MPCVSHFYGILIYMYYDDHAPPHFHARYGDEEAVLAIETLSILRGGLPRRAKALALEWADLRRTELRADWELARARLPLLPIPPLE